jgi:hypothetical protein
MKKGIAVLALIVLAVLSVPGWAQFTPEEIKSREYWEDFLMTARIVESRQLSSEQGITQPYVLTLEKDGITQMALWKPIEGLHKGFYENWRWEIAAYRLDKHLDLNMIPPTVERRFWQTRGSLQLWVKAKMSLREKNQGNYAVPQSEILRWNRMMCLQRAFDNLIANEDRHQGNYLITDDWRIVLIDHSRSFRTSREFTEELIFTSDHRDGTMIMRQLPRSFLDRIQTLDFDLLKDLVGPYLTNKEIRSVLMRRDLVIDEMDRIIGAYGQDDVLY